MPRCSPTAMLASSDDRLDGRLAEAGVDKPTGSREAEVIWRNEPFLPGRIIGILGRRPARPDDGLAAPRIGYKCHIFDPQEHAQRGRGSGHFDPRRFRRHDRAARFAQPVDVDDLRVENLPVNPFAVLGEKLRPHFNRGGRPGPGKRMFPRGLRSGRNANWRPVAGWSTGSFGGCGVGCPWSSRRVVTAMMARDRRGFALPAGRNPHGR